MFRFVAGLLAAMIIVAELAVPAKALTLDWQFYANNGIDFYDPTETCDTNINTVGAVQLSGADNTEQILNFFMTQMGLNLAQASGFIGNMFYESGLNPAVEEGGKVVNDDYKTRGGVGFGLVQWTSRGRQVNLEKHMTEAGVGITNLSGQLSFVQKETTSSYPGMLQALRQTNNPGTAAVIVHGPGDDNTTSSDPRYQEAIKLLAGASGYETSGDSAQKVVNNRSQKAQEVYDKYKDAPALAGSTADSNPTGEGGGAINAIAASTTTKPADSCDGAGSFAGGDFAATLKAYAHAQYNATRTDQLPAYTEAVQRAQAAGRYVGGSGGGVLGNDCGAFVSLLIVDSGYDKDYNAYKGATSDQERWLKENWTTISAVDATDRQPGDVAINGDHTYIYVGQIEGFDSQIASASLDGPPRAPMAGKEAVVDGNYRWYRKKAGGGASIDV